MSLIMINANMIVTNMVQPAQDFNTSFLVKSHQQNVLSSMKLVMLLVISSHLLNASKKKRNLKKLLSQIKIISVKIICFLKKARIQTNVLVVSRNQKLNAKKAKAISFTQIFRRNLFLLSSRKKSWKVSNVRMRKICSR